MHVFILNVEGLHFKSSKRGTLMIWNWRLACCAVTVQIQFWWSSTLNQKSLVSQLKLIMQLRKWKRWAILIWGAVLVYTKEPLIPFLLVFQLEPQQRRVSICRLNWSSYNISAVHCLGCLFDGVQMTWLWDHIQDATQKSQKAFVHVASEIGAYEAEEIGMLYSPFQRVHDFCYASMKLV